MDKFTQGSFLEHPTIDIGTWYFTSRKDDPAGPSALFDDSVDPKGILASIVDDNYFYGSDNVVQYYTAHIKSPGDVIRWGSHVFEGSLSRYSDKFKSDSKE